MNIQEALDVGDKLAMQSQFNDSVLISGSDEVDSSGECGADTDGDNDFTAARMPTNRKRSVHKSSASSVSTATAGPSRRRNNLDDNKSDMERLRIDRALRRQEQNKASARAFRQRRKLELETLQGRVKELEQERDNANEQLVRKDELITAMQTTLTELMTSYQAVHERKRQLENENMAIASLNSQLLSSTIPNQASLPPLDRLSQATMNNNNSNQSNPALLDAVNNIVNILPEQPLTHAPQQQLEGLNRLSQMMYQNQQPQQPQAPQQHHRQNNAAAYGLHPHLSESLSLMEQPNQINSPDRSSKNNDNINMNAAGTPVQLTGSNLPSPHAPFSLPPARSYASPDGISSSPGESAQSYSDFASPRTHHAESPLDTSLFSLLPDEFSAPSGSEAKADGSGTPGKSLESFFQLDSLNYPSLSGNNSPNWFSSSLFSNVNGGASLPAEVHYFTSLQTNVKEKNVAKKSSSLTEGEESQTSSKKSANETPTFLTLFLSTIWSKVFPERNGVTRRQGGTVENEKHQLLREQMLKLLTENAKSKADNELSSKLSQLTVAE